MDTTIVGFIGFGLIGGSIARTLKEIDGSKPSTLTIKNEPCAFFNIAYDYHKTGINTGLSLALEDGTIDKISKDLSQDFKDCDLIFLCAPVLTNIEYLKQLKNRSNISALPDKIPDEILCGIYDSDTELLELNIKENNIEGI